MKLRNGDVVAVVSYGRLLAGAVKQAAKISLLSSPESWTIDPEIVEQLSFINKN